MSKHICIVTHQHLCRNPRVLKEAIALAKLDYKVTILNSIYSKELLKEDYLIIKGFNNISFIHYNNLTEKNYHSIWSRVVNKTARYINYLAIETIFSIGYAPYSALKKCININPDLYIMHQELPTVIGNILIDKGKNVAFDLEDWYTQDLLPEDRKYRPDKLLQKAECTALNEGKFVYTTSIAMAEAMQKHYKTKITPSVIYNSFPTYFNKLNKINASKEPIKLIWISQTIGPGRGLEDLIKALNKVTNNTYNVYLRGNTDDTYQTYLNALLKNKQHQISFLGLITNEKIQEDLCNYDIGLALEPNYPINRDLTITNKIFHYLSVGLPVIASETQGQLSLKNDFKEDIYFFSAKDLLVDLLNNLSKPNLQQHQRIISLYQQNYDWHLQEKQIQELVNKQLYH